MTSHSRAVSPMIAMGLLVFMTVGLTVSAAVVVDKQTNLTKPHPSPGTHFDKEASQHVTIRLVTAPVRGDVFIRSPLGTETPLERAGDRRVALAFANGPTQIIVKTDDETYVATSRTLGYGVKPDVIVAQDGSGDYTTVQAAVNNAPKNATIAVKRNIYRESVEVNRSVDIVAETGTVFTPNAGETAFNITANNLTLQNVLIRGEGSGTGVAVTGSGVGVAGNQIMNLSTGVKLNSQCVAVQGNVISGSDEGVYVVDKANSTLVSENDLSGNNISVNNADGGSSSVFAPFNYWGADDPNTTTVGTVNESYPLDSYEGPFTIGQRDIENISDSDSGHGNECGSPSGGDDSDNPGQGGGTDSAPGK